MPIKLAVIRSDAPRDRFPVFISNSGRSHTHAGAVASTLSQEWHIELTYEPDPDDSKQGVFYLNASKLSNLEIEGVHRLISWELKRYPKVYNLSNP